MRSRCGDIDLAWYEVGRGQPLILIHGLADDHRAWRRTVAELMLQHRVVLFDLRGHGDTTLGNADGTLRQLSEDLIALLDAIDLARAFVVGFSLGGTVAMRAALDKPDRVAGLGLIATSSRVGRTAAAWYRDRAEMVAKNDPTLRSTLDKDCKDVYRLSPDELSAGLRIRRESTADPAGYGNACLAMAALNSQALDSDLPRIGAPTLIVASELDQHCPPRAAEIIAAGIAGSRLEVIRGAGHPIPVERPGELAQLVTNFIALAT
jgi:3-oxoadipate enol-lactonase